MSETSTTQHYLTALYQSPYIKAINLIQESFAYGDKLKTWELLEAYFYGLPPDASKAIAPMFKEISEKLSAARKVRRASDEMIQHANQRMAMERILRTANLQFYQSMIQIMFKLKYLEKGAIVGENPNPDHIGLGRFGQDSTI